MELLQQNLTILHQKHQQMVPAQASNSMPQQPGKSASLMKQNSIGSSNSSSSKSSFQQYKFGPTSNEEEKQAKPL